MKIGVLDAIITFNGANICRMKVLNILVTVCKELFDNKREAESWMSQKEKKERKKNEEGENQGDHQTVL